MRREAGTGRDDPDHPPAPLTTGHGRRPQDGNDAGFVHSRERRHWAYAVLFGHRGAVPSRSAVDESLVRAFFAVRGGVVRRSQLIELGMTGSTVDRHTGAGGRWQRPLPGVVVAHNGPLTPHERLLACLYYCGADALLTGTVALDRLGLRSVRRLPQEVAVLIPHAQRRKSHAFVVVERTIRLPRPELDADGLPWAPPARAVVDLCRRLHELDVVREVVAEAVQAGHCSVERLVVEVRDAQSRGSGLPRRVLREVAAGVRSVIEARIREGMRRAGIPDAQWNVDLLDAGDGTFLACVDAYWEEYGVALQIDSMEWHLQPKRYKITQARQRDLTERGVLVLPVAPSVAVDDFPQFLRQVRNTLAEGASRPRPRVRLRPASTAR